MVLVFSSVLFVLFSGLAGFIYMQDKHSRQKAAWQNAMNIAEAGIDYYRWHLAHAPDDLRDGTGGPGPYEHNYSDPESGIVGRFSLEIAGEQNCGLTSGISITSTGWTNQFPDVKRKISVKYIRPTVADYSYFINDNVWVGADHEIKGPYHSNGGVRMDGENNSLVTSAKETWFCTESFGCSPAQDKPGVFGAGENSDLWRFPVPSFDFLGITVDLAQIKVLTQGGQGLYFAPSGAQGYRLVINQNQTIDVWRVNSVNWASGVCTVVGSKVICDGSPCQSECSQCSGGQCVVRDPMVASESFLGNYGIFQSCGLVFFEDNLWVGRNDAGSRVRGKITIASADLINPNRKTDIWLQGNIEYTVKDGSDGLIMLSQGRNLISLYTPDIMMLEGVYIAQNGQFGRNHYPSTYSPYHKRDKLELYGSVVSNGRVGTKWSSGGIWISGYNKRESTYDTRLSSAPPPFLPVTSDEHTIKEWEEVE